MKKSYLFMPPATFILTFIIGIIANWFGFGKSDSIVIAICLASLLIIAFCFVRRFQGLERAVEDLNLIITDPDQLKFRKEQAALAKCIREGIENKKICKGMNLDDLHRYVNQGVFENYTFCPRTSDDKSAVAIEEQKTGKRREIVIEYFASVPTPGIYLYFEHGKLIRCKAKGYGEATKVSMKQAGL